MNYGQITSLQGYKSVLLFISTHISPFPISTQVNTFKPMQAALKIPFGRFTLLDRTKHPLSDNQSKQPTTALITCEVVFRVSEKIESPHD